MSISLFPHNQQAYEAVVGMLAETGKACVIHPTGTGKSFIAFKYCEAHPEQRVLWLSPSEYIFKTQCENLISTGAEVPANICFYTYAKLSRMGEGELDSLRFDVIICDEFHRIGAPTWGENVAKLLALHPEALNIGLTATNVRFLDSERDMAAELYRNCIASRISLGEAIVRGILSAPKYVTTLFSCQQEYERYKSRVRRLKNRPVRDRAEKYLEALRRQLEKSEGLEEVFRKHMPDPHGKYVVFTANVAALRACLSQVPAWFCRVDASPRVYWVHSYDKASKASFSAFKADTSPDHLRLLFAIDKLNEGVHLDDVNGVILFRPTESPIIYKQQIGRALSVGMSRQPVIFDIVNNFEHLYSIGSIEAEMQAAVTYYNFTGEYGRIEAERFQVIDVLKDCRELFLQLEETLNTTWESFYALAKTYYETYGDLNVPVKYKTDGYPLGSWVSRQRAIRAGKEAGFLSDHQIALLDRIGMRWQSLDDLSWNRHYQACLVYRETHGDLDVPHDYVTGDGLRLGAWIMHIRRYKASENYGAYFTREREELLNALGMIWDHVDYNWERNYAAAKAYYDAHGSIARVPKGTVQDGVKLSLWLQSLRKRYRGAGDTGSLTPEQIRRLDGLGMQWESPKERAWRIGMERAKAWSLEHGQFDTPVHYVAPDGYKLGDFIRKCREKYKKGKLTPEEICQLEAIGVVWDNRRKNDWDICFAHVRSYYLSHGNLKIPGDYKADGIWLAKWLNEQKQIANGQRDRTLTEDQIKKLESIGFLQHGRFVDDWERKYNELLQFQQNHGSARVPRSYVDQTGGSLNTWVNNQKKMFKTGKMQEDRAVLLHQAGVL